MLVASAQLKGKLTRKEEDMEDLLVSNVFGSIKYLEPREVCCLFALRGIILTAIYP